MGYLDYVNIKMGTESVREFSNGNTLPIVSCPFGTHHFAPETREAPLFFHPRDVWLEGVRLTHMMSPWLRDYHSFTLCPTVDDGNRYAAMTAKSTYDRDRAVMTPALLGLHLNLFNIDLAFAPTEHGGVLRADYRFDGFDRCLKISPRAGALSVRLREDRNQLTLISTPNASNPPLSEEFKMYCIFWFDAPVVSLTEGKEGIVLNFGPKVSSVTTRFGVSFVSEDYAAYHLRAEVRNRTPEEAASMAEWQWEQYLSCIEIEAEESIKRTFYSCLWRCFLFPRPLHETAFDNRVVHGSPALGGARPGPLYTDNCLWDTFRTLYPLLSLLDEKRLREICEGYLNFYEEEGWLPRCAAPVGINCMPGTAIDAIFADAAVKGTVTDRETLVRMLEALNKHVFTVSDGSAGGRDGVGDFNTLGYVSDRYRESVNKTQDYSYGNFCVARVARASGREAAAESLLRSAENWKNLFDPATGFLRAKSSEGLSREDFTELDWGGDYTEGSVWQNTFSVPHDLYGYAKLLGGRDAFLAMVQRLFDTPPLYRNYGYRQEIHEMTEMAATPAFGQCALSNQPSFHIPYLFACMGDHDRTAFWVRKAVRELFSAAPDGFPGDEDTGSMSAWYIFSALGFYPVCPGTDEYVLGSPAVEKAVIRRRNGTLTVIGSGQGEANVYVKDVTLDGVPLSAVYLTHRQLTDTHTLTFDLSPRPAERSYPDKALPYSMGNAARNG